MSASYYWRPSPKVKHHLPSNRSDIARALEELFGRGPRWTMDETAIPALRGAAAADRDEGFWKALIAEIEEHHEIDVWVEY